MAVPIILLIFVFIFLLLFGANLVVVGLRRLTKASQAGLFALSAIALGLATSLPELSVAITSGINQNSSLSLGNVLGANIANLTLVAGGAAIVAGKVVVSGGILTREVLIALLAGILPLPLLFDSSLSRIDGLILIAIWGAYVAHFFRLRFVQIAKAISREGFWYRFLHRVNGTTGRETTRLLVGIALLLFSADIIVRLSKILAQDVGMPLFLVGVLILAVGTTLPELAFSFRSLLSGEPTMFFGNILGSIVANSTLIVGVASVFSPITISFSSVLTPALAFLIAYFIFWFFIRTKHTLSRAEAAILLLIYIIFVVKMLDFAKL